MRYRILFISGRPTDARHLSQMLHSLPVDLETRAEDLRHACKLLDNISYQVILTEANLSDGSWLDVLEAAGGFGIQIALA